MISYREGNQATPADVLVGAREDAHMHRRAASPRDFYTQSTYTVVSDAEHELWHPNYLAAIGECLHRLSWSPITMKSRPLLTGFRTSCALMPCFTLSNSGM